MYRNLERIDAGLFIGSSLTRIREVYIVRSNQRLASPTHTRSCMFADRFCIRAIQHAIDIVVLLAEQDVGGLRVLIS